MALPVNIDDLINHRKVEWARIEYKEGWNPEKILHTLCAFANDIDNWGGGYIIIGIAEENGRPVFPIKGIEPNEVDVIQKELLNVCHLIEPVYLPVVEPCVYEGKCLLIVWAPGGCERPYRCPERIAKDVKSPKAYYIRKLASTVKATRQDEKELFELTGDVPFDDRPNVHADITDLKMNLLVEYLHEVGSDLAKSAEEMSAADVARNMQIASGPAECFMPKNVGLMFFNPHPENFFRCAWIDVVDKPDPTPEAMTISSLPGPERSITDADLAACRMIGLHYRNRRIGDFLKELDLVEGRNTGIPVVVNVMRENGSPPPVFSSPENRDWLSVILPVNPHFRKMEDPISERTALKTAFTSQMGTNKDKGEECVRLADSGRIVGVMTAEEELEHIKVALKTALKTALIRRPAKVIERMGLLLQQLLRDKDITIVALASLLGASRRTVQEDIAILKNLKVLDRVGPDNGGEWVVLLKW
jgi:predicted HTH transcriptional regulator